MNLLKIVTATDGVKTRALLNFGTYEEALAALYYEMWYQTSNENTAGVLCAIINDDGHTIKCERYYKPVDNQESEETEA